MKRRPIWLTLMCIYIAVECLYGCEVFGFWPKTLAHSPYMPWIMDIFRWNPVLVWICIALNLRSSLRNLSASKEDLANTWMR